MSVQLKRRDVYPGPLIDGLPAKEGAGARLARQFQRALTSRAEREEAAVEGTIRAQRGVTRANLIAVASASGGTGKSTVAFVLGNLLASHLNLRVIAVDANPEFGTLGRMPPDERRAERSLVDLVADADRLRTAAELNPYVSRLATGLHVLGAEGTAARIAPDRYGELAAFLACFYEVVVLDLGTGTDNAVAEFALDRADQVLLVSTPDWMAAELAAPVIPALDDDRLTHVTNKSPGATALSIPHDAQLATMLDAGCYSLDALARESRVAIKRLGLTVARKLV